MHYCTLIIGYSYKTQITISIIFLSTRYIGNTSCTIYPQLNVLNLKYALMACEQIEQKPVNELVCSLCSAPFTFPGCCSF